MRILKYSSILVLSYILFIFLSYKGIFGSLPKDNEIIDIKRPTLETTSNQEKTIFFGDLHVHTTFSQDAFLFSLPMLQGEGAHPPADACNFARFCSSLDFFSITDHAEGLTKSMWEDTLTSLRNCDQVSGKTEKDIIVFAGWEWTQMDGNPKSHFGHKNVILKDLYNLRLDRPIGAKPSIDLLIQHPLTPLLPLINDFPPEKIDLDFLKYRHSTYSKPFCSELNDIEGKDCREVAETPKDLFAKLDSKEIEALVIPHGTTWGIHAPEGASFSNQLLEGNHDPKRQRLIEVYSGHGNSEVYKDIQHVVKKDGSLICPEPSNEFEPCCWRAGEIVLRNCLNSDGNDCNQKSAQAKQEFVKNISNPLRFSNIQNSIPEDWMQCGQLINEFLPTYTYRPLMSVQAGLVSVGEKYKDQFKLGLIGSSDNHKARAGSGYKEFARKSMGDAWGAKNNLTWLIPPERGASFYSTGGLVAVHAKDLDRDDIYNALYNREVYATSGERILLWFNLLDKEGKRRPMGSEVTMAQNPIFEVRVLGSFKQNPGCPEYSLNSLSEEELSRLCLNECYNPSNERNIISKIEIIKIIPTKKLSEYKNSIFDPWKTILCEDKGSGCTASFTDEQYSKDNQDVLYYVRAIQEDSLAVGGNPLRCEKNSQGECIKINPCYASGKDFDPLDDCLSPIGERAWSSPIFLSYPNSS